MNARSCAAGSSRASPSSTRRRPGSTRPRRSARTSRSARTRSCCAPPPSPRGAVVGPGHDARRLRGRARAPGSPAPTRTLAVIGAGARRRPVRLPAPGHLPRRRRARSAPSSRRRTPRSATAARCRTSPTSATRRSGRAVEHRREHDHRELRRRAQAPHRGRRPRCAPGRTTSSSRPLGSGTAPRPGPARSSARTCPPVRSPLSVAPQRNIEGWVETNRPGTDAATTAARPPAAMARKRT